MCIRDRNIYSVLIKELLVVGKLDGILKETVRGELEFFWNILTKVFKCHYLKVNVVYQTEEKEKLRTS